jgi:hypothetical protein
MDNDLFVCVCGDLSHQLIVSKDKEESEVIVTIHLTSLPFLERVKVAFKYLLGNQSKYGAFEEVILSQVETNKLVEKLTN